MARAAQHIKLILDELHSFNIKGDVEYGSKHPRIVWKTPAGRQREMIMSSTPSDYRTSRNALARLRRFLRDDKVMKPEMNIDPRTKAMEFFKDAPPKIETPTAPEMSELAKQIQRQAERAEIGARQAQVDREMENIIDDIAKLKSEFNTLLDMFSRIEARIMPQSQPPIVINFDVEAFKQAVRGESVEVNPYPRQTPKVVKKEYEPKKSKTGFREYRKKQSIPSQIWDLMPARSLTGISVEYIREKIGKEHSRTISVGIYNMAKKGLIEKGYARGYWRRKK